jgi:hypothetical protein
MVEERGVHRVLVGKPEGKRGLDGVDSGVGRVADTCEYSKEPSGSIKMGGIS